LIVTRPSYKDIQPRTRGQPQRERQPRTAKLFVFFSGPTRRCDAGSRFIGEKAFSPCFLPFKWAPTGYADERVPHRRLPPQAGANHSQEKTMSKGMDQKKDQKKKPAKTMKEKKAEKREKKNNA
jgi:hypothetical protein